MQGQGSKTLEPAFDKTFKLWGRHSHQNLIADKSAPFRLAAPENRTIFCSMALSMKASTAFGAKLVAPQRTPVRARTAPAVSASLREDVAR